MTFEPDNPLKIFSDRELKAALMRACPPVAAPESLKSRISQMVHEAASADAQPPMRIMPATEGRGLRHWFTTGRRLAAAASIAGLGLGIGLYLLTENSSTQPQQTQFAAASSEPFLVEHALANHDALYQSLDSGDEQVRRSLRTAPQMQDQLREEKSILLRLPDLSPQGWQFVGAKPCPKASCCSAQLFYRRGKQSLSVFVFSDDDLSRGRITVTGSKDHLVALSKIAKGLVCVVAQCPTGQLKQDEVDQIAAQFAGR